MAKTIIKTNKLKQTNNLNKKKVNIFWWNRRKK